MNLLFLCKYFVNFSSMVFLKFPKFPMSSYLYIITELANTQTVISNNIYSTTKNYMYNYWYVINYYL